MSFKEITMNSEEVEAEERVDGRPQREWFWYVNTFALSEVYAGTACLLHQVNTLCIPVAVVYNESPEKSRTAVLKR